MIYIKGEMCMFIHADRVLVHGLSSDSLMTSCHISLHSPSNFEGRQKQEGEEEEEEEGGRKTIWETEHAQPHSNP